MLMHGNQDTCELNSKKKKMNVKSYPFYISKNNLSISDYLFDNWINLKWFSFFSNSDHKKATPLHLAIASKHIDIVKWICSQSTANVDAQDSRHNTPLHIAAKVDSPDIVDVKNRKKRMTNKKKMN